MMHLLLVGCGKMGSALLAGWQKAHHDSIEFSVIEPGTHAPGAYVHRYERLDDLPQDYSPDVIVFAVKPQQLEMLLPAYASRFSAIHPLYISIAAGKTLDTFTRYLGRQAQIVRVMPNTPALVGRGMSVIYAPPDLPAPSQHLATMLMDAVGSVTVIHDEALMDAVTAISGSGPAYVFLFLESLTKAGMNAGLDAATSRQLALETLSGSIALASQSTDSFEQLRNNVTSPGGTTEAALRILMQNNRLEALLNEAVQAAKRRSQELKS